MTKWQVFRKEGDSWETWDVEVQGEVFDSEEDAHRRADEMDAGLAPEGWGYHFVKQVEE